MVLEAGMESAAWFQSEILFGTPVSLNNGVEWQGALFRVLVSSDLKNDRTIVRFQSEVELREKN